MLRLTVSRDLTEEDISIVMHVASKENELGQLAHRMRLITETTRDGNFRHTTLDLRNVEQLRQLAFVALTEGIDTDFTIDVDTTEEAKVAEMLGFDVDLVGDDPMYGMAEHYVIHLRLGD